MPRSGTTLTEQILASHPQIHGAGELRDVGAAWQSLGGRIRDDLTLVETINACGTTDQYWKSVSRIADQHLHGLREREGRLGLCPDPVFDGVGSETQPTDSEPAKRITDKLPDNYQQLGWIASMFPRARVIHCRRDLRDVAVSCWMTNFKSITWSSTFANLASRIEPYRRVMDRWLSVLPIEILEVDYEHTVADVESMARRLSDLFALLGRNSEDS
jgi:hypothetical protein